MSGFTRVITLKQHSPFIHFQVKKSYGQREIVELPRISELKPLIGRFVRNYRDKIKEIINRGDEYEKIIETYFNDNTKKPGAYKLHLTSESIRDITATRKDTAYFGDSHQLEYKGLQLSLFSFHTKLLDFLERVIPVVLCCYNLGTRKSKGFGSFAPAGTNRLDFEKYIKTLYGAENVYRYNKDITGSNRGYNNSYFRNLIKEKYQILKSGINYKGYDKSKLYEYYKRMGITWEKKFLKKEINAGIQSHKDKNGGAWKEPLKTRYNQPHSNKSEKDEYRFIRAVLGLAGHSKFQKANSKSFYNVDVEHDTIKRIPSPLMFKVFDSSLYAIATWDLYEEHYKTILDETFNFVITDGIDKNHDPIETMLKTPERFDIKNFLNHYLTEMEFKLI